MEKQRDTFEITTREHWKAFSHPLRLSILSKLRDGEMTNEELAKAMGVESGKLYFHTKMLLNAGMIEPAGTRRKGPITEKLYRAAARSYYAPPPPLNGPQAPFADMMSSALAMYQEAWAADPEQMDVHMGYNVTIAVPKHRVREVALQLRGLLQGFAEERTDAPNARPVSITLLMYSFSADKSEKKEGSL